MPDYVKGCTVKVGELVFTRAHNKWWDNPCRNCISDDLVRDSKLEVGYPKSYEDRLVEMLRTCYDVSRRHKLGLGDEIDALLKERPNQPDSEAGSVT